MSVEDARAELERIMESGHEVELREFIRQSYEDDDKLIAIIDALYPDATEREAGEL